MNIDLIAKLKGEKEFFNNFKEEDLNKEFSGSNLLFYLLTNHDLDSRYKISKFLINKGIDVLKLSRNRSTPLHYLLSQVQHNLPETIELCRLLIEKGVDINSLDCDNRVAFQYIINMRYSDEELRSLYDLWFSQPKFEFTIENRWGKSPLDLVKQMELRKTLLERMLKY